MNLKQLAAITETTVLSAVAAFLAAVSQLSGPAFDLKHLQAAGVAALVALAYKMSAVLNAAVAAVPAKPIVSAPAASTPALPATTPQTPPAQPPAAG